MRRCIEAAVLDTVSSSGPHVKNKCSSCGQGPSRWHASNCSGTFETVIKTEIKMEIKLESDGVESSAAAAAAAAAEPAAAGAVEPADVGSVLLRGVARRWVAPTEGQLQVTEPAAAPGVPAAEGSRYAVWRALRVLQRESGAGSESAAAVVEPGSVLLCELTAGGYLSQAPARGEINSGEACTLVSELRALLTEPAVPAPAPLPAAVAAAAAPTPVTAAAEAGSDKAAAGAAAEEDTGMPQVKDEEVPETVDTQDAAAEPKPMELESAQEQPAAVAAAAAAAAAGGGGAPRSRLPASERPICEVWLELLTHLSAAVAASATGAATTAAADALLGAAQTGALQLLADRSELLDDIAAMAALGTVAAADGGNDASERVGRALADHCEAERATLQRSLTAMGEAAQVLAEDAWWGQRSGAKELRALLASAPDSAPAAAADSDL